MKVAYTGLNLPPGSAKYNDRYLSELAAKFKPAKSAPYYFEFLLDDYETSQAIAIAADELLDLLILDMEKIENILMRMNDENVKSVLDKCLAHLETEKPLCNLALDDSEKVIVNGFGLVSSKPTVVFETPCTDVNQVCAAILEKAGMMFFYTLNKQEVHAWLVEKGTNAVTCAEQIHSDLARGFIKAELVSCDDLLAAHSLQDARSRNLTKLVDKDYIIPENTILEIRFNV
ncbi:MAG: DUF933 domain-containing protein [Candidatus Poribacteria bacterium]|nr:DUF933 domain-containing protein [Candidatus Poribacteria bacterium]